MASAWEDFERLPSQLPAKPDNETGEKQTSKAENETNKECDWGFDGRDCESDAAQASSESSKFINLYEQYLDDKQSFGHRTDNHQLYASNPAKALREWFDYEGHEFCQKFEHTRDSQFICSIDVPVGEQDFTFTSEAHPKRQAASDEVCLVACKLLDDCGLLKSWQQDKGGKDVDRKRRIDEANKEDDIELDDTARRASSEPRPKKTTYESLKAKWSELNMTILGLKAKLVKLDLSLSRQTKADDQKGGPEKEEEEEEERQGTSDEEDPLDAFMSNLNKKTELTLDEKIEKSRIKCQISALEREQEELGDMMSEME